ncbi:hypothetical protein PV733_26645 [Streptomyces europaeiscabiei]|uniref:hypothetical protein n=1 Tax=Streptomyces europaeiscabiei TaxID=146819 RepID=UPI0029AD6B51|nr:hypothetical protein [Streptomyces europaeiscabiei]MDX3712459.1 hypothetical protein [Streptomyces europaeiscabiei]MDX3862536.1 hypothetical protein [Streptomyces europaeiscabiei]
MTGLVLVPGLLVVLVAGPMPRVYAAEPDPTTSWAGSRAGEGRERPGRQDAGPVEPEDDAYTPSDAYVPSTSTEPTPEPDGPGVTVAPEPSRDAALPFPAAPPGTATSEEPVLQVVSLGSGLMLVGLGLGLAFVGLRMRRD